MDNLATQKKLALEDAPLWHHAGRWCGAALVLALTMAAAHAIPRAEPTVDELKARVSSANTGEKAKLCIQIAEKQLSETDKLYATDDVEKAQSALSDVVSYSELARDYSIQTHKNEKQTEIAVRGMIRKLNDMLHTLSHEEQTPLKDAIGRLQLVRNDLLKAMFPKGGAK